MRASHGSAQASIRQLVLDATGRSLIYFAYGDGVHPGMSRTAVTLMAPADARMEPQVTTVNDDAVSLVDLRCSVVIFRGDEVLLLHRRNGLRADWVLPGGRPRPGESTGACARREVAEETGLHVDPTRCAFVLEVTDPNQHRRTVEIVFLGQIRTRSDDLTGEPGNHPTWVPLSRLSELKLRPPIGGYLAGIARNDRNTAAYLGNMWRPERWRS